MLQYISISKFCIIFKDTSIKLFKIVKNRIVKSFNLLKNKIDYNENYKALQWEKIYIDKIFRKVHLKNSLQFIPTLFDNF